MKKFVLVVSFFIILGALFFSCTSTEEHVKEMTNEGMQEETYLYYGNLFYKMNNSVGLQNKPQSKLWHYKGQWYGILPGDSAQGHTGTHLVHIQKKAQSVDIMQEVFPFPGIADVFPFENKVFIVFDSFEDTKFKGDRYFAVLEYDDARQSYLLKEGFPIIIGSNRGDSFAEGSTIAVDSTGVVWICYDLSPGGPVGHEADGSIGVMHSTVDDYKAFSDPLILLDHTISDDIAKIVAWNNKIGVFISDQARWEFRFIWRDDTDDLHDWLHTEIAENLEGSADDHINYAYDGSTKNLYFATKDSFDYLDLYQRSSEGSWGVTEKFIEGSRPMINYDASGNNIFGLSYQFVWSGNTDNLVFDSLSVGGWGTSKDMSSTQQPCDSTTGFIIAKKHFGQLELLYIPLTGPALKQVDVVDWIP